MSINLSDIKSSKKSTSAPKENVVLSTMKKEFSFSFRKELSIHEKEDFYAQIAVLIGSGLDILSSFDVLKSEKKSKKYDSFLDSVYNNLLYGASLSNAVEKTNKVSLYEYYTIKVGEETGKFSEVLDQLAKHYTHRIQQKRNLINTLSYPVVLIVTAFTVVLFMLNFIVPMFEDLFKRFNGELPPLTQFIIHLSAGIKSNFLWIIGIVLLIVFTILSIHKKEYFRAFISRVVLKIPRVNVLVQKIYIAKFCQLFALLSGASIPIVTSLQLIKKIIGFYPFEIALDEIEQKIVNGSLLYEAMAHYPIFDAKLISLTKVGEEVNRMTDIYQRLSEQYLLEVDFQMKKLNTLFEPLIIILVGGGVATILISMYLPMFKMGNTIF